MDITAEKLTTKYLFFRDSIFERDGDQCRNPDCGRTADLRIYHLELTPEKLYDPDNATTYCKGCFLMMYSKLSDADRPGRGFSRFLTITVKTLSDATGKGHETIRRHIRSGKLDPWDLKSIKKWLNKNLKEES